MENQLIVAVRLCDSFETEQPDPLCLRQEEIETWRLFEALLLSLYRNPPEAIRVKYLDDENDWIELGSDSELAEAVKVTKDSGEILQLQIQRADKEKPILIDNSTPAHPVHSEGPPQSNPLVFVPTTDPDAVLDRLVYPYPSPQYETPAESPAADKQEPHWLIYPHPTESVEAEEKEILSTEPRMERSKAEAPKETTKKLSAKEIIRNEFDSNKDLSLEEKVKFLKDLLIKTTSNKENKGKDDGPSCQRLFSDSPSNAEPLCSEPSSLGHNFIPNQDPFDVNANEALLDSEQMKFYFEKDRSPTLTPTRISDNGNPDSSLEDFGADSGASVSYCGKKYKQQFFDLEGLQAALTNRYEGFPQCMMARKQGEKCVGKPRNTMMMMEGAQSGANAVAIEMPSESDFFLGTGANKEEEIAASGGASSTPASEETGEVLARDGSVAAAVIREMKTSSQAAESCAVSEVRAPKSEKKSKRSDAKSKLSKKEKKQEPSGVRPKEKSERKNSKEQKKKPEGSSSKDSKKSSQENSERKKEEKKAKVTEDVESGEKLDNLKGDSTLQLSDFVKHLRKMKKDVHANIVKDVAKQTEKIFRKVVVRSMSVQEPDSSYHGGRREKDSVYHIGIYCDNCNSNIVGIRYKCGNCVDFDLCERCENTPNIHDETHVFLKLRMPARKAGFLGPEQFPLLRENVYLAERERLKDEVVKNERAYVEHLEHSNDKADSSLQNEMISGGMPRQSGETTPVSPSPSPERVEINTDKYSDYYPVAFLKKKNCMHSFDLLMAQSMNSVAYKEELEADLAEEKLDVVPMTRLEPSQAKEESKDLSTPVSPAPSDSSSSIVPVSPPADIIPLMPLTSSTAVRDEETAPTPVVAEARDEDLEEEQDDRDSIPDLIPRDCVDEDDKTPPPYDDFSFEEWDSDTSDDFCIIDPPAYHTICREDYEVLKDDTETEIPQMSQLDREEQTLHPSTEPTNASSASQLDVVVVTQTESAAPTIEVLEDSEEAVEQEKEVDEEHKEAERQEEKEVERDEREAEGQEEERESDKQSVAGVAITDEEKDREAIFVSMEEGLDEHHGLIHKMNEEEKSRFVQLLKAEMDKEYEEELQKRAKDLEKELLMQKEKELKIILEAKEQAAAFENERLEWVEKQKKDEDERLSQLSRQTSCSTVSGLGESPSLASEDGASAGSVSDKKDANCQTIEEPISPASHIIHNVATGVSKAAVSAYHTAKDVFYSLQAKQNEWKAPSSTYKPPQSTWKPPTSKWIPPKDSYVPPISTWKPPQSTFVPPNIEWINTTKSKARPGTAERKEEKEGAVTKNTEEDQSVAEPTAPSAPQPAVQLPAQPTPVASLEGADLALRQELQKMQHLIEMGFANREKNRKLLNEFKGDLEKVVQSLLQEEGSMEDDHWSFSRH